MPNSMPGSMGMPDMLKPVLRAIQNMGRCRTTPTLTTDEPIQKASALRRCEKWCMQHYIVDVGIVTTSNTGNMSQVLPVRTGNAPDRVADIVGDQQRTVLVDGHSDGAA